MKKQLMDISVKLNDVDDPIYEMTNFSDPFKAHKTSKVIFRLVQAKKAQRKTIYDFMRAVCHQDVNRGGRNSDHLTPKEMKSIVVAGGWGEGSDSITIMTEVGMVGDEGTAASYAARDRRMVTIGVKGGLSAYNMDGKWVTKGAIYTHMK